MRKNCQRGQSVVELVFAVIMVVLFLTGAVLALIVAVAARGESLARKNAARLAEMVMEEKTGLKLTNPENFWNTVINVPETGLNHEGFEGYTYSVGYSLVENPLDYPDCLVSLKNCVDVLVTVNWSRKADNKLVLKKFFAKGF